MKSIKVGKHSFNSTLLKGVTLQQAYDNFPKKEQAVVKMAWERINPNAEKLKEKKEPEKAVVTPKEDKK